MKYIKTLYGGMTTGKSSLSKIYKKKFIDTDNIISSFLKSRDLEWSDWLSDTVLMNTNSLKICSIVNNLIHSSKYQIKEFKCLIVSNLRYIDYDYKYDRSREDMIHELTKRGDINLVNLYGLSYKPLSGSKLLKQNEYIGDYLDRDNIPFGYNSEIENKIMEVL